MKYELIHQDASNKITVYNEDIPFLAFVKHATFAGINSPYSSYFPFRYLSLLFEFSPSFLYSSHFKKVPELSNDPTETAYISNKIGRTFADYFSKKIYKAKFTHNYESAMKIKGLPISGARPDFYCDTLNEQFAVEAKGYSAKSISDTAMKKHKEQSRTGSLDVNFSVASVAYNLYNKPKIKFYDPEGDNILYDNSLNLKLRALYYDRALNFIELISYEKKTSKIPDYFAYIIKYPFIGVREILVHKDILYHKYENIKWLASIEQKYGADDDFYIDVDGIGLSNLSS